MTQDNCRRNEGCRPEGEDPLAVDALAAETARGFDSKANFPTRLARFARARESAIAMSQHISEGNERLEFKKQAHELRECRTYLVFREYQTRDVIRLHGLRSCRLHLLCPGCAMARGSRLLASYVPKHEQLLSDNTDLRSQMLTLTVKDGEDLEERVKHLTKCLRIFLKRRHRERDSEAERIRGAVYSIEVKRGERSGLWHPHVHMFVLVHASAPLRSAIVQREWKAITGDSFIVDVRDTYGTASDAFCEIFKYALKLNDLPCADALSAYRVLRKRRMVGCVGVFHGVEVSDSMTDDLLDDESLPYFDVMFTYLGSSKGGSDWYRSVVGVSGVTPKVAA